MAVFAGSSAWRMTLTKRRVDLDPMVRGNYPMAPRF